MNNTKNNRRRKINSRKRKNKYNSSLLTVLSLVLAIIFCISLKGLNAGASNEKKNDYKYFKVINVEAGDTLGAIANEYYDEDHYSSIEDYILEIKYSNNILDENNLISGQNLVIPYYSSEYHL